MLKLYIDGHYIRDVEAISEALDFCKKEKISPLGLVLKKDGETVYKYNKWRLR